MILEFITTRKMMNVKHLCIAFLSLLGLFQASAQAQEAANRLTSTGNPIFTQRIRFGYTRATILKGGQKGHKMKD